MAVLTPEFATRLARGPDDIRAAQRLRYEVFVEEMGADGAHVDHDERLEIDRFDDHAEQLLLLDLARASGDQVVGVYRLITAEAAQVAGGFYTEGEYDLTPLIATGRPLLELGRSCLHPDYRGGAGMFHLWQGLAAYVREHGVEILFGVASFAGQDPMQIAEPLAFLHDRHLAPEPLRVRSQAYQPMDLVAPDQIDRVAAMKQTPALIKAYLRLGGVVGDGAFVDRAFNTIDVCLIVDTSAMSEQQTALYQGRAR